VTIKVKTVGVADVVVENAHVAPEATVDEWVNWSFRVHNIGETGIMGGMVQCYSGPSPIDFRWRGEEQELPVSDTRGKILYYTDARPECTRFETNGQIKFREEGTYVIRILGVHQEPDGWYYDDYKEFTVVVTAVRNIWDILLELWNALEDWQKLALITIPAAAIGIYGVSRAVRK